MAKTRKTRTTKTKTTKTKTKKTGKKPTPTSRIRKQPLRRKMTKPITDPRPQEDRPNVSLKTMFTLQQMMRATPWKIKQNARNCRTRVVRAYFDIDKFGIYKRVLLHSWDTDGMRRVLIKLYGDYKRLPSHRVWIHCSGPYFLYHSEVALARKGSSSIINSNGQLPKVTNPYMMPKVCKHCYSAFKLLKFVKYAKHARVSDEDLELLRNFEQYFEG